MKKFNLRKIVLTGLFSMVLLSGFLTPGVTAQVWTYNGADTEKIPNHSVYPSEWYIYNTTGVVDKFYIIEISHGNVSDPGLGDSNCVWGNLFYQDVNTGELQFIDSELFSSWNNSIGYHGNGFMAPVGNDGKISQQILDDVKDFVGSEMTPGSFEYNQSYLSTYSFTYWNETSDDSYLHYNFTSDGIITKITWYYTSNLFIPNSTLVSRPVQLPPVFSFNTVDGNLDINSADIKFNVSIIEVDNNNDGTTDTDYQYRILIGSTWTNWTTLTGLIDYDLRGIPSGVHQITLEVKNMYGTTQEQITIQYTPPPTTEGIPGYSTMLITGFLALSASIIMVCYYKKSRYRK